MINRNYDTIIVFTLQHNTTQHSTSEDIRHHLTFSSISIHFNTLLVGFACTSSVLRLFYDIVHVVIIHVILLYLLLIQYNVLVTVTVVVVVSVKL